MSFRFRSRHVLVCLKGLDVRWIILSCCQTLRSLSRTYSAATVSSNELTGRVYYRSEHKFDSGCGWPAYWDNIEGAVDRHVDNTFGMRRVEITCSNCGGHLGHVFEGEVCTRLPCN